MPVWLVRLAASIVPPEKAIKIILCVIIGSLATVLLLFSAPIMVYKHIPLGKTASEFQYYVQAAKQIEDETGILINFQKIMAIDAVLLEQDFSSSSVQRAYSYKQYFIREEIEYVQRLCAGPPDENGNVTVVTCYQPVRVFYERDFDEVLWMLVADRKLRADQIEDVKRYTMFDISPLAFDSRGSLSSGWMPVIRDYAWPIQNNFNVTSLFGPRTDPIEFVSRMHNGIDIGAPQGTDVLAVKDGKVIYAKYMGSAGNTVIIQHENNVETRYYHLYKISVTEGQEVKQYEKIGEVGSTGRSTGPHLHFEFRISGTPVDPMQFYQ